MTAPKTLLELAGADLSLPSLAESCLVLIDIQNEYRDGPLALPGAEP
ncbi:MAG: cysteine hydrolase, partial [Bradyrhizobium sp.]|nr:cysteine hydrolase [Bradyrhizobium sp.]